MFRKMIFVVLFCLLSANMAGAQDPVAWWKLDDGSGNIAVDSGPGGLDAAVMGDPQWIEGRWGAALDFDGVNDYIELPIGPLLSTLTNSSFTIWADFDNTGGQNWQRLWDFGNGTQVNMFLTPRMGTTGDMRFAITIGGNAAGAEDQTTADDTLVSGWHHVALVIDIDNTLHRLYIDGEPVAENTEARYTPSDLGSTSQNWLGRSQYAADGFYYGALDDFRIYDYAMLQEEIQASMVGGDVFTAIGPYPNVDAVEVPLDVVLSWKPGKLAVTSDLYFGTDANDVNDATIDDPRDLLVVQGLEEATFDPSGLDYDTTYYWRIDAVNQAEPNSPWKGKVWSFTTANYIILEDFEDYNDNPPDEIWNTWIDGFGNPNNGSIAGYPDPDFIAGEHFVETDIVHGGAQSMPVFFNNGGGLYSEVTKTLTELRDWTVDDVITLTLFFYGDFGNRLDNMYVALNESAVVVNEDPKAVLATEWTQWDILLQDFADQGINLASVNSLSLGFGDRNNPVPGGSGHVFFDDIRLSRSEPIVVGPEEESVDPGTGNLRLYYAFENNFQDTSGRGQNGAVSGNPSFVDGPTGFGMAAAFDGTGDFITLPIGSLISSLNESSFAAWVNLTGTGGGWQRAFDFGSGEDINMFLSPNAGGSAVRFAITVSGSAEEEQLTIPGVLPAGWHHLAVTIDPGNTTHTLYMDGKVVDDNTTAVLVPSDLGVTTQNWIGLSQYPADPFFVGSLDEFRIYNKVLSGAEVRFLAGR